MDKSISYILSSSSSVISFIISIIILIFIFQYRDYNLQSIYNFIISVISSLLPTNNIGVAGTGVPYVCPSDYYQQGLLCYKKKDVPDGYDWTGDAAIGQITKTCPNIDNQPANAYTINNCSYQQTPYPLQCSSNLQQSGLLCYDKCPADKPNNIDGICWPNCPDGFTDFGVGCTKPSSYGNGVGYIPTLNACPNGSHDVAGTCWTNNFPWTVSVNIGDRGSSCNNSDTNIAGLCYAKCKPGFHSVGGNICSPNCPDGWTDSGVSCTKPTTSVIIRNGIDTCPPDHPNKEGALCYDYPVKNKLWEYTCIAGNCNLARNPLWPTPYSLLQTHSCPSDHPDDEGNSGLCYPKPPNYYTIESPTVSTPYENCGLGLCSKPYFTSSEPIHV